MKQTKKELRKELAMTHRRLDQSIAAERELEDKLILCQERLHTQLSLIDREVAYRSTADTVTSVLLKDRSLLVKEAAMSVIQPKMRRQISAILGMPISVCPECGWLTIGTRPASEFELCGPCCEKIKWPYEKKYEHDTSGRMDPELMPTEDE